MAETTAPASDAKPATIKQVADFFRLPGQGLKDFTEEWKALPEPDKAQIRAGLGNGTLTY